jgi:hypothetical protein
MSRIERAVSIGGGKVVDASMRWHDVGEAGGYLSERWPWDLKDVVPSAPAVPKVFWFFFSKKNFFPILR